MRSVKYTGQPAMTQMPGGQEVRLVPGESYNFPEEMIKDLDGRTGFEVAAKKKKRTTTTKRGKVNGRL